MTTATTEHELNQMGLRDLQSRFREVVGEETRCPNKTFLVRRIVAALAAQQANDTVSANMVVEAPSTSGSPTPEPEATAPPESERRPTQPAIEAAVAAPPDAEPTSAEPLADGAAIDPTSTEAIATASAVDPTSDQPIAAEPSVSQPFAEVSPRPSRPGSPSRTMQPRGTTSTRSTPPQAMPSTTSPTTPSRMPPRATLPRRLPQVTPPKVSPRPGPGEREKADLLVLAGISLGLTAARQSTWHRRSSR